MPIDAPLTETFGVEIECLAKCSFEEIKKLRTDKTFQWDEDHEVIQKVIYSTLHNAGIPVNSAFDYKTNYNKWTIAEDSTILEFEESQGPTTPSLFRYFGFELKSRILPVTAPSSFQEITSVLHLIKSRFDLVTNMTCGLHVHVGNGTKGFPVRTLRTLAQLVTAFEPEIHRLHADSRIQYPSIAGWCLPPSKVLLATDPLERHQEMQKLQTVDDVRSLMNPLFNRCLAYNFKNLASANMDAPHELGTKTQTVEFRQHAASVDADEIVAWVQFTTGLVRYSHSVQDPEPVSPSNSNSSSESQTRHFDLCIHRAADDGFSILDLMQAIGLGELVPFYEGRLYRRERVGLDREMVGRMMRHEFWKMLLRESV